MDGFERIDDVRVSPQGHERRMSKYEIEKLHGDRRSTGALKLNRLKPRHYRALFLHMNGARNYEIARVMGWSECHVSLVLNDPLSQEFVARGMSDIDGEFRALLGPTVDTLKEALNHPNPDVRLKAADKVLRVNGKYDRQKDPDAASAESIIQRLLEQVPRTQIEQQINVQVNTGSGVDPYIVEQLGAFGKEPKEWPAKEPSETAVTASPKELQLEFSLSEQGSPASRGKLPEVA